MMLGWRYPTELIVATPEMTAAESPIDPVTLSELGDSEDAGQNIKFEGEVGAAIG